MVTGDHRASGVHTGRERSARLGRLGPGTGILMGTLIGAGILMGTLIGAGTLIGTAP